MSITKPSRGQIWLVDLNPTRGHEQAAKRPCLVVSVDLFNQGASGLAVVLPITSSYKMRSQERLLSMTRSLILSKLSVDDFLFSRLQLIHSAKTRWNKFSVNPDNINSEVINASLRIVCCFPDCVDS